MALTTTIGGASSDSYGTLAGYETYATGLGWTTETTDAADEANLRRAAQVIDRDFDFAGYRQYETQALAWPRQTTIYVDGWAIDADTIPQRVISAQFELAYLIQGGLDPAATVDGAVARAKAGPVEVDFVGGKTKPRIVAVEGLLRPLLANGFGALNMVRG